MKKKIIFELSKRSFYSRTPKLIKRFCGALVVACGAGLTYSLTAAMHWLTSALIITLILGTFFSNFFSEQ